MLPQQVKVSDITDENSAQTYLNQAIMTTFCRVLDSSRLPPDVVMRLLATAIGSTYREVAAAHQDGQCPCGWRPVPDADIEALRSSLEGAAAPKIADDLHSMVIAGRA
ncbi:hypothetical protein SAMN03159423_3746 [Bradyrhizobium sp. NFR13]|jgi:hypothetical protein|uniref:hypothetical protein n=1 Tax=Bradyrhizobium sp. NFR13 TaxID=1566285 RepID=UPI0008E690B5|nr:hypothetical protein [Bradyrhizobium sp. NFR13]SFL79286.1 hypothetical protein SAMN03159423_3746 [Bradyrhizobium sp. NFR13]